MAICRILNNQPAASDHLPINALPTNKSITMVKFLLLLLMPAAVALNPVVGRALAGAFEPGQLTVVRWLAAGALVAIVMGLQRLESFSWQKWWRVALLGALGMGFCSYAAYASSKVGTATNVSLIYTCTAALVVLYEIATRQVRPGFVLIGGVVICLFGAVVIVTRGEFAQLIAVKPAVGDLWALAGMSAWAVYTVAMKRRATELDPLLLFTVMSFAGSVAFVPVAGIETLRAGLPELDFHALMWIVALVLIASVGANLSYNEAIRRTGPILTSAALSLSPLYTALMAVALVGEELAWYHAVGGALVIIGLITINFSRAREG